MRRKRGPDTCFICFAWYPADRTFSLWGCPSVADSGQSESSHSNNFTSRFQRGGLSSLTEPSTFSRALRFISTLARA